MRALELNRGFDYGGGLVDDQLRAWNHVGLFASDIGPASAYGALADPADTSAPLAARARAYLATNCAQCHRPGGTTGVDMDLRFEAPLAAMNLVGVRPQNGSLGLADAYRVKPGAKDSSVLWERIPRRDATQMPPLATTAADPLAVSLIGQWVDAGP